MRGIRLLAGANDRCRSHTNTLFSNLGVLTVDQIRLRETGEFMYRYNDYNGLLSRASLLLSLKSTPISHEEAFITTGKCLQQLPTLLNSPLGLCSLAKVTDQNLTSCYLSTVFSHQIFNKPSAYLSSSSYLPRRVNYKHHHPPYSRLTV